MRAGWALAEIGDLLTIQNGFAFDSKNFSDTKGVPLIRIRDLRKGRDTETKYSGLFDKRYEVKAGDFLIGMDGEFGCYEWKGGTALLNQRVCRLQDFSEKLEPRFLFYGINKYLKEIEDATTYTTVKHLSSKQISSIEIPLPPLPEQQRIVAILDEAFAGLAIATANVEKNLKNARGLFDSFLNSVFAADWKKQSLGEICENLDSKRVPITKKDRKPGSIPYYGASGAVDSVADFIFDEDLLLVSEDGANLVMRTYPIAFSISGKSWVNNHAHVLRVPDLASQKFVEYYLNSISLAPYINGMAQPKLNQKALNSIQVPWPPLNDRERTAARLDELAAQTERLRETYDTRITALADLKQSILQNAFSGALTSPPSQALLEAAE